MGAGDKLLCNPRDADDSGILPVLEADWTIVALGRDPLEEDQIEQSVLH
jgi:hypothetical protein